MTNITTLSSIPSFTMLDRILPSALGFDHVFATLDNAAHLMTSTASTFPPVNIIKTGDYTYNVELAVAGYKRDEIEITAEKNSLRVSGKKTEKDEKEYLAKGIAVVHSADNLFCLTQLLFKVLNLLMAFSQSLLRMSFLKVRSHVR